MFPSRDPELMVMSEYIRRHVELFVRDGGKIERLPDYNAFAISLDAEFNGRKTSSAHASRGGRAGRTGGAS